MPESFTQPVEGEPNKVEDSAEVEFWQNSSIMEKIARQRGRGYQQVRTLITDRDGTHSMWGFGFRGSPQELAVYEADTARLNDYIQKRDILLIMNTGGSIEMMEAALKDGSVPADAAISASGSEFHIVKDGKYVAWPEYQAYIENVVGFQREAVYAVCAKFLEESKSREGVGLEFQPRDSLENVENWRAYSNNPLENDQPQTIEIPQKNKISFYVNGGTEAAAWVDEELHKTLAQNGMGHFRVVLTADPYENGRYLLDVIPLGKREAADIVVKLLSQKFGPVLAAVAGDAQNDAEVILNSGTAAIAVGNRVPDLEQIINDQPASRETRHFKIVKNDAGEKRCNLQGRSLASRRWFVAARHPSS